MKTSLPARVLSAVMAEPGASFERLYVHHFPHTGHRVLRAALHMLEQRGQVAAYTAEQPNDTLSRHWRPV